MTPKEYIIHKLKEFARIFPGAKARYENVSFADSHYIEITPDAFYRDNKTYISWEEDVVFDFIAKYPNQNISFHSCDSLAGLNNIDYEVSGLFVTTMPYTKTHAPASGVTVNVVISKNKAIPTEIKHLNQPTFFNQIGEYTSVYTDSPFNEICLKSLIPAA